MSTLSTCTDGFNGADIESVVNETVERCFLAEKQCALSTQTLVETAKSTISISKSCAKQIEDMKSIFKSSSFKDATTGKMSN